MTLYIPNEIFREIASHLHEKSDMKFFHTCQLFYTWQPLKAYCKVIRCKQDMMDLPIHVYRIDVQFKKWMSTKQKLLELTCSELKINLSLHHSEISSHLIKLECDSLTMFEQPSNLKIIIADSIVFFNVHSRHFYFEYLKVYWLIINAYCTVHAQFLEIVLYEKYKHIDHKHRFEYITFVNPHTQVKIIHGTFTYVQKIRLIGNIRLKNIQSSHTQIHLGNFNDDPFFWIHDFIYV